MACAAAGVCHTVRRLYHNQAFFLPIEKIDQAVEEITASGDLSKRVDVEIEGGKDEIHRLAVTFNSMFDRLEKSFNTERQFTSDASHELRTPVSVIKAHCEYALKYAQTPEELRESLQVIERQATGPPIC